jgi:DNA-binding GntR family transcriptional regulator
MASAEVPNLQRLSNSSRQGLPEWIYQSLIDLLLDGTLTPDQPIRIDTVADQLGVSATPVREALVRLQATGLVFREARKGFRVAPAPAVPQLVQLIEARLFFEPAAARVACAIGDASLIDQLEHAFERQARAGLDQDLDHFKEFLSGDQAFHDAIIQGTGNPYLRMAADALNGHVQRFRAFHRRVVTDSSETVAEHRSILHAFIDHKPEDAEEAMRHHLLQVQQRVSANHAS